ncbi:cupin domain-containing protein [Trichothermofontia sp.]
MKILPTLLAPLSIEAFLTEYWTQKAIHITGGPAKFGTLFSWQDLNDLLNYHQLAHPDLRFSIDGKSLPDTDDRQIWRDRLSQGATLIVNGLHHRLPALAVLTANLRQDIGYRAHVNLYCSPAQQQGFDCHYDTHDVLILQIDGAKEWFVYHATVPYPTDAMPASEQLPPEEPPYLHCVLQAGDVLYIPRGHWHYAVACDRPSLHLTVGIDCLTGMDWLDWLLYELQADPDWRQSFPAIVDGQTQALTAHLAKLQQKLSTALQHPDWQPRYLDEVVYCHQPPLPIVLPAQLPAQMGVDLFPQDFLTEFAWSPLHLRQIRSLGPEHYQIQVGSKQVDLKGIPAVLAENLAERDRFTLADLADWAPDLDFAADVVPLLSRLLTEGLLQVVQEVLP